MSWKAWKENIHVRRSSLNARVNRTWRVLNQGSPKGVGTSERTDERRDRIQLAVYAAKSLKALSALESEVSAFEQLAIRVADKREVHRSERAFEADE